MTNTLFIVANMRVSNGVTSVIMNQYDKLRSLGYSIDFCSLLDRPSPYIEYVKNNGSFYSILPSNQNGDNADYSKAYSYFLEQISSKKYDIVHVHIEGKFAALALKAAKELRVPYRVYHSHNPLYYSSVRAFVRSMYFRGKCVWYANKYFACSVHAGKSVFGHRDFHLVRNTIDTQKFCFNGYHRTELRTNLGCKDGTMVVGTICRQTPQKNPYYMIDIWYEIYKRNSDAFFIWVGTGELEEEVKSYAEKKLPKEVYAFLGNRTDVDSLYCAMDVFVLPSLFEGLGIVFIEAQSCGTITFASQNVPVDTQITDRIYYVSLKESPSKWADEIIEKYNCKSSNDRSCYHRIVHNAGYDSEANNDFCDAYEKMIGGRK